MNNKTNNQIDRFFKVLIDTLENRFINKIIEKSTREDVERHDVNVFKNLLC